MKRKGDADTANYQIRGEEQARSYLLSVGAELGTMTADLLRNALSELEGEHWFQTSVADFWLGLTERQGKTRRSSQPPPSPFSRAMAKKLGLVGQAEVATREQLVDWDRKWLARLAVESIHKDLVRRPGSRAETTAAELLDQERLSVLIDGILGVVGPTLCVSVPAFQMVQANTHRLQVRRMKLSEALRHRWVITEDRLFWLDQFRQARKIVEADLTRMIETELAADQRSRLAASTGAAAGPARRRGMGA